MGKKASACAQFRKLAPKQVMDENPALVSVSKGRQTHSEVPTSQCQSGTKRCQHSRQQLPGMTRWRASVLRDQRPPPFQNLPFFVEPVGDKARLDAASGNTERWLHVSDPRGSPEFSLMQGSQNRVPRLAPSGRDSHAPLGLIAAGPITWEFLVTKQEGLLLSSVNKRSHQILYEFMNIATREWKKGFMNC